MNYLKRKNGIWIFYVGMPEFKQKNHLSKYDNLLN